MKKLFVLAGVCALALNLSARDDVHHFSIEDAQEVLSRVTAGLRPKGCLIQTSS